MALDASIGGASANSYVSLAEANAFFATKYGVTAWTVSVPTDPNKEAALITATKVLDQMFEFLGIRSSDAQALEWPRSWVPDPTRMTRRAYEVQDIGLGIYVDANIIPGPVKEATYEMALYLIQNNGNPFVSEAPQQLRVGPIMMRYGKEHQVQSLPIIVKTILQDYGSQKSSVNPTGQATMAEVVR